MKALHKNNNLKGKKQKWTCSICCIRFDNGCGVIGKLLVNSHAKCCTLHVYALHSLDTKKRKKERCWLRSEFPLSFESFVDVEYLHIRTPMKQKCFTIHIKLNLYLKVKFPTVKFIVIMVWHPWNLEMLYDLCEIRCHRHLSGESHSAQLKNTLKRRRG